MRVGGQFVGIGLGDRSLEVQRIKELLRRKFSYASKLDNTELYNPETVQVVAEAQRRYEASGKLKPGSYTPGIVNYATKIALGLVRPPAPRDERPVLFTVCGTGVPWWVGPDADTARAVESRYRWQPIGYPAQAVPMGRSIAAGKAELEQQFEIHRDQVVRHGAALAGYSQGAIVISETWSEQVRNPSGRVHWAYPAITKTVTWGNPCREKGRAWPDMGGPVSPPEHGGVTDTLLWGTPNWWRDYAHAGDLYSDSPGPQDSSGQHRTAIWQVIRDGNLTRGPDSLLRQLLEIGGIVKDDTQLSEVIGLFRAMMDAIMFFGSGTRPHVNYSTAEAIAYLMSR